MYGDWSRRDQMKFCQPSPTLGIRKAISDRFRTKTVDEFRTSKTCNRCMGILSSYTKRNGRKSYSRLCCTNYRSPKDLSKRFVNRDLNAAANILLAGTLPNRPAPLRRTQKRPSSPALSTEKKMQCFIDNKPAVDAVGTSNNLVFLNSRDMSEAPDANWRL